MAQLHFDATQIDPQDSFECIPAGEYTAIITDSEIKPTKAGTGSYLQLTYKIHGGAYDGRLLWDRLNVSNPNKQAEEIANKALSSICHAVGVLTLTDTVQLHGKPLTVKVKVKNDPQYGDKNEISGYKPADGFASPVAAVAAKSVPWKK